MTEFRLGPLTDEHCELVYEHYETERMKWSHIGKSDWLAYISDVLRNHPSACVFETESGKPVSWSAIHYEGFCYINCIVL